MKNKRLVLGAIVLGFGCFGSTIVAQNEGDLSQDDSLCAATVDDEQDQVAAIDDHVAAIDDQAADQSYVSEESGTSENVPCILDPFIVAVALGDLEEVKRLMAEEGTSVNYAEPVLGLTPLLVAIFSGNESLVAFLIEQPDLDVNKPMNDGLSPIHCAVLQNNPEILWLLLTVPGINLMAVDEHGLTAETKAKIAGYTECLELLQNATAALKKS